MSQTSMDKTMAQVFVKKFLLKINDKITGNNNYVKGTTIEYLNHVVPYPHFNKM